MGGLLLLYPAPPPAPTPPPEIQSMSWCGRCFGFAPGGMQAGCRARGGRGGWRRCLLWGRRLAAPRLLPLPPLPLLRLSLALPPLTIKRAPGSLLPDNLLSLLPPLSLSTPSPRLPPSPCHPHSLSAQVPPGAGEPASPQRTSHALVYHRQAPGSAPQRKAPGGGSPRVRTPLCLRAAASTACYHPSSPLGPRWPLRNWSEIISRKSGHWPLNEPDPLPPSPAPKARAFCTDAASAGPCPCPCPCACAPRRPAPGLQLARVCFERQGRLGCGRGGEGEGERCVPEMRLREWSPHPPQQRCAPRGSCPGTPLAYRLPQPLSASPPPCSLPQICPLPSCYATPGCQGRLAPLLLLLTPRDLPLRSGACTGDTGALAAAPPDTPHPGPLNGIPAGWGADARPLPCQPVFLPKPPWGEQGAVL